MTSPKALLEKARASIAEGRTAMVTAKEQAATALTNENIKGAFQAVKDALNTAEKSVKNAHKALVDAISATKAAAPQPSSSKETPSAETSNSVAQ